MAISGRPGTLLDQTLSDTISDTIKKILKSNVLDLASLYFCGRKCNASLEWMWPLVFLQENDLVLSSKPRSFIIVRKPSPCAASFANLAGCHTAGVGLARCCFASVNN